MSVKDRFESLKMEIEEICERVQRDPKTIQIVAVTKYVSIETTKEALDAGVTHIGENRAEGGLEKWQVLNERGTWHFIGSLQTRKVKNIVGKFDYIHSLDRLSLAEELDKRCETGKKIKCFLQVNVAGEESKAGLEPSEVIPFLDKLKQFPSLEIVGLMTMAPFEKNPEQTRPVFKKLRQLRNEVQDLNLSYAPCQELSMGMSNDYRVAIEEGATFLRIGSALVGSNK